MNDYYKFSKELSEAILNYMAQKPYVEVYELISAIQGVEKVEEALKGQDVDL